MGARLCVEFPVIFLFTRIGMVRSKKLKTLANRIIATLKSPVRRIFSSVPQNKIPLPVLYPFCSPLDDWDRFSVHAIAPVGRPLIWVLLWANLYL